MRPEMQRFGLFAVVLLIAFAVRSFAATGPVNLAPINPVRECSALLTATISTAVGAPTHVTSAIPVPEGKPAAYCDVKGYVEPAIQFEVRLPLTHWTQRLLQTGCGGLCGNLNIHLEKDEGCLPATNGELALASTDMGHSGGNDGQFGEKEYQLRIDFAYRGVHATTLAAKALIGLYYGAKPRYSYFAGCSDGGREALMEAQRFPGDFNGITAGAPAMNFTTQNTFYHGWNGIVNQAADGNPILTAAQMPILHRAALASCDLQDGLKDGLISDPVNCHVDLAAVQCKLGEDPAQCLTSEQVRVAREIYAGAHDGVGNKMVLSGPLPGSELAWTGVYIPRSSGDRVMSPMISTGTLKYLAYPTNPPAEYSLADLKFDAKSFTETTRLHSLYDATDPDLSPFQASGGKLILWHGLADPHISPLNTIAYYTALTKQMGQSKADTFTRLYLFPGGYHCGGGEGPFDFDLLSTIMAWVERGDAPSALFASHRSRPDGIGSPLESAQSSSQKPDRTRPVYPYPLTTVYTGHGSIDDASNFTAGPAKRVPASALHWLGEGFYSAHYEQWCEGDGASMHCTASPESETDARQMLDLRPDHATVSVADIQTEKDWYTNKLGFVPVNHIQRGPDFEVWQMSLPGYRIDLVRAAGSSRPKAPTPLYLQQGWVHVVFTSPDLTRAYDFLHIAGTDVAGDKDASGKFVRLILHDPEGNEIEIFPRSQGLALGLCNHPVQTEFACPGKCNGHRASQIEDNQLSMIAALSGKGELVHKSPGHQYIAEDEQGGPPRHQSQND